ncbi:MAG: hypothetical protein HFI15_15515 [Lachnospiraceae bacterium]|jgi:hypothetical protein|nr:hypothetical protein [Lachnospiraceae bacterium]
MKNLLKSFCIVCSLVMLLLLPVSAKPVQAAGVPSQTAASEGETIQPRAPIIRWLLKEIDGKMYRRLYNYSTGEWIGDWIPCE